MTEFLVAVAMRRLVHVIEDQATIIPTARGYLALGDGAVGAGLTEFSALSRLADQLEDDWQPFHPERART
jgi:hypothetical protein